MTTAELLYAIAEPYLMQTGDPAVERLYRRRLRLIGNVPALLNHPALREIEAVFASFDRRKMLLSHSAPPCTQKSVGRSGSAG